MTSKKIPAIHVRIKRAKRYAAELRTHTDLLDALRTMARSGVVTLVYSAHDEAHNNAVVLQEFLLRA